MIWDFKPGGFAWFSINTGKKHANLALSSKVPLPAHLELTLIHFPHLLNFPQADLKKHLRFYGQLQAVTIFIFNSC